MPTKIPTVEKAMAQPGDLSILVDGLWCDVAAKPAMLDVGLCLLLDSDASGTYFADTYTGRWPGNAADSSTACNMPGGTNSAVVATLLERYTAMYPVMRPVEMPVPSEAEAAETLPVLRARRHAAA